LNALDSSFLNGSCSVVTSRRSSALKVDKLNAGASIDDVVKPSSDD
jgi:hypothetical protein